MRGLIILDTQLMVLWAVGATSPKIISKHKNLTAYTIEDFELLEILIGDDGLLLLPNIVSETANLLRQHKNPERRDIMQTFASLVLHSEERYIASTVAVQRREYARLGVADSAILEACLSTGYALLTGDLDLYQAATELKIDVTNFNHRREEFGLM